MFPLPRELLLRKRDLSSRLCQFARRLLLSAHNDQPFPRKLPLLLELHERVYSPADDRLLLLLLHGPGRAPL